MSKDNKMPDEIWAYVSYVSTSGGETQGHGWRDAGRMWNGVNEIMGELYEPSWSLADSYIKKSKSIPRDKVEELIEKWEKDSWEYYVYEPEVTIYDKCREELQSLLNNEEESHD